jgi:hypothetical protein
MAHPTFFSADSPESTEFLTAVTAGLADPGFRPCALRGREAEARARRLTGVTHRVTGGCKRRGRGFGSGWLWPADWASSRANDRGTGTPEVQGIMF